jgi:hypothetical protein
VVVVDVGGGVGVVVVLLECARPGLQGCQMSRFWAGCRTRAASVISWGDPVVFILTTDAE